MKSKMSMGMFHITRLSLTNRLAFTSEVSHSTAIMPACQQLISGKPFDHA